MESGTISRKGGHGTVRFHKAPQRALQKLQPVRTLRAGKGGREFRRAEAVQRTGEPSGARRIPSGGVGGRKSGGEIALDRAVLQARRAGEVQANLQAPGVKTRRPVDVLPDLEIMPFDAQPAFGEAAEKRLS